MRYSIFFAIVLVLVSGFVAYFGDLLGRRMGKKRLSLFGVRPRYTAIIVTTITGMIIAGLTLITLISINPAFKKIFAEGEAILARNKTLSAANKGLETRNKGLIDREKQLEKEVADRQAQYEKAKKETANALKAMQSAVRARDKALSAIKNLERDIVQRQDELTSLRQRNQTAESELMRRSNELQTVQSDLAKQKKKLIAAQADLIAAGNKLVSIRNDLTTTQNELTTAERNLAENKKHLDFQTQQLRDQQQMLVKVGRRSLEFESSRFILRQNEELARIAINEGESDFAVLASLQEVLRVASDKAEELGAKKGGNDRCVHLIFKQSFPQVVIDDEPTCLRLARKTILDNNANAFVQVVCANNTLIGEQAQVEFKLYVNDLVYKDGRFIARTRIDGTQSEGRLLLALTDFLRKEVSESAIRAGIVPISNPDPRMTLGKDPASQVDALMDVVEQIKAAKGPVRVDAYANGDICAIGPLSMDNMRFKVVKLN